MARVVVLGAYAESLVNLRGHLLQEMVRNGHEVIACAPGESQDVSRQLAELGVTYKATKLSRAGLNPITDLYSLYRLIRLFRSIKPQVFLGYSIKPVVYGSLAARLAGVTHVYSMIPGVGYAFSDRDSKSKVVGAIAQVMYRYVLKFNRCIFFQNPDDRQLFLDLNLLDDKRKACLINGSGVDIDVFAPSPFPKKITFILISRLIRDKGIVEYAEAAHALRQKHPDINCRLVGFFEDTPSSLTKADVTAWTDEGSIDFLGALNDVRPALANCSVFVLPSYYREGTPRAILEAMAMGRPIITTDAPGCRETVESGINGYLIPVRDVRSLIIAMESFIENPDRIIEMGAASRKIAIEKYDVRKVTATILDAMQLD